MQEIVFEPDETIKVLVVGDIILDQYIYGETDRISPEAPVPVVRVKHVEERPGGAANVAVNVASLGVNVQLLGITGDDAASSQLQSLLESQNVECHFISQKGFPTIIKKRILSQHQQLIRLDYENSIPILDTKPMVERYLQLIDGVDVIVLSDYAKGSLDQIQALIIAAREKNILILVDPKSNDFSCYEGASVLTPNLKEFEMVVGKCSLDNELIEKGSALCDSLGLDALLVTRGEQGMTLLRQAMAPLNFSAETHEVYDVTGAGDTVIAVLATALACRYGFDDATTLANIAAGLVVEKLGAASVTVDEINYAAIKKQSLSPVVNEEVALSIIRQAKKNGERIVMTNGCFDLPHAGHVNYLAKARSLGDRLLVAVNDDGSVKRLKGKSRPINTLKNRMAVLGALAAVDLVVAFSEDTPERLIKLLQPDVLVKGGDYTEDQIAGAKVVRANQGDVVIVPFEEATSTTQMLDKIKKTGDFS